MKAEKERIFLEIVSLVLRPSGYMLGYCSAYFYDISRFGHLLNETSNENN